MILILKEDKSIPKRKSTIGFEDLKQRRSAEQQQPKCAERTKTVSIGVVPKTRQTISLASVETDPISSNVNPKRANTNLKSTSHKSMSKSLQDNSKLVGGEQPKLVVIETRSSGIDDPVEDKRTVSVKSKIKLMESIVHNRTVAKSAERSSSTSSSKSSSSSSSRSPPISPKNTHSVVLQPAVKTRQKPMAPISTMSNVKLVKSNMEMSTNAEDEPALASMAEDDDTLASTNLPLAILKEKRRTVKELMSKFEPK